MTTIGFGLQPTGAPTCLSPFTIVFQTTGGSVIETLYDGAPPTNANPNPSTFGAFTAPNVAASTYEIKASFPEPTAGPPVTLSAINYFNLTAPPPPTITTTTSPPTTTTVPPTTTITQAGVTTTTTPGAPTTTTTTIPKATQAPHLSGIAALIKSKHPDLRPFQLKTVLWATAANVQEAPTPAGRLTRTIAASRLTSAGGRATSALRMIGPESSAQRL